MEPPPLGLGTNQRLSLPRHIPTENVATGLRTQKLMFPSSDKFTNREKIHFLFHCYKDMKHNKAALNQRY